MIRERILLDDGVIVVTDVRCEEAPVADGLEETARATAVVIPLDGLFIRTVRRPGSRGGTTSAIGDPSRALVFRPGEPYRVAHPVGGGDRSLVIALQGEWPAPIEGRSADCAVPPAVQVAARRLAWALADGAADALAGAELAIAIVDAVSGAGAGADEGSGRALRARTRTWSSDAAVAHRTRLRVAASLDERVSLPELGRRVGLSGWELARRFRRATGTSIHRYRTALRVQAALKRIEDGERDLTGLALDLGFADHSHLANVLRRETGRPPSAFRRPPTLAEIGALRTNFQA